MVDLFRNRKWDLIHWRNVYFLISLLVIVPGMAFWAKQGFNLGIDFTGGGLITYTLARPLTADQASQAEQIAGLIEQQTSDRIRARVQITGDITRGNALNQVLVRTLIDPKDKDAGGTLDRQKGEITTLMQRQFPPEGGRPGVVESASEMVSPVVSKELIWNAVQAVLIGCIFILGWIRIRYLDFKWAFSAVVALAHDVLVLLGVFAIFHHFEINMPFVAAALTVVGFSVHDTIIIFDRIRENLKLRKGATFAETANISLLETMARSVNTVATVLFVLLAVMFFGGRALQDFTFAMLVGVVSGAYSSIFNASQILVVLKQREERATARRRAAQVGRRAAAKARPGQVAAPAAQPKRPMTATQTAAASGVSSSSAAKVEAEGAGGASEAERAARTARGKKMKASGKRKRRF